MNSSYQESLLASLVLVFFFFAALLKILFECLLKLANPTHRKLTRSNCAAINRLECQTCSSTLCRGEKISEKREYDVIDTSRITLVKKT